MTGTGRPQAPTPRHRLNPDQMYIQSNELNVVSRGFPIHECYIHMREVENVRYTSRSVGFRSHHQATSSIAHPRSKQFVCIVYINDA